MPSRITTICIFCVAVISLTSVYVSATRRITPPEPVDRMAPLAPVGEPLPPCEGSDNLGDLMQGDINKSMSKLSYALYHDRRGKEARMENVAQASLRLFSCVRRAAHMVPDHTDEGRRRFYEHLDNTQYDLLAIHNAARENDEETLMHWMGHLRRDCLICHSSCKSRLKTNTDLITDGGTP